MSFAEKGSVKVIEDKVLEKERSRAFELSKTDRFRCRTHYFTDSQAEFHNNRAERALGPEVIFRKLSFGNRTPDGAYNYQILATVLETCRLKRKNLSDFIHSVWLSTKDQLIHITRDLLDTS